MSEHCKVTLVLGDAGATEDLGRRIGERLESGDAVALIGDLGAGKTGLARGIALGLRVADPDAVTSPTYLLAVEHDGPIPMLHVDAYLPEKTRAFLLDGGADYLGEIAGVVVVEWADRVLDLLPSTTLQVQLAPCPEGRRAILSGGPKFSWMLDLAAATPPRRPAIHPEDPS